jgi:Skp family chaperone for outer membrane proteins
MEKRNKEVNNLRKVVVEIAQEIGKKEGFTMVMSNAGVLYYDVSIDLTDKVVQLLNQRMAGK